MLHYPVRKKGKCVINVAELKITKQIELLKETIFVLASKFIFALNVFKNEYKFWVVPKF